MSMEQAFLGYSLLHFLKCVLDHAYAEDHNRIALIGVSESKRKAERHGIRQDIVGGFVVIAGLLTDL